jgi:hypothetical protein
MVSIMASRNATHVEKYSMIFSCGSGKTMNIEQVWSLTLTDNRKRDESKLDLGRHHERIRR